MEIAKIVLEYLRVFLWPAIFLVILFRYHKYIVRLLKRFIEESEEISTNYLAIKFRKEISSISKEIGPVDSKVKETINERINAFAKDQFRVLCLNFFSEALEVRGRTANEISILAKEISLADLLALAKSPLPGERVGAVIGIATHIRISDAIENDERVIDTLREGLSDPYSRVRFRIVQAIGKSRKLVGLLKIELMNSAHNDENDAVREKARRVLRE